MSDLSFFPNLQELAITCIDQLESAPKTLKCVASAGICLNWLTLELDEYVLEEEEILIVSEEWINSLSLINTRKLRLDKIIVGNEHMETLFEDEGTPLLQTLEKLELVDTLVTDEGLTTILDAVAAKRAPELKSLKLSVYKEWDGSTEVSRRIREARSSILELGLLERFEIEEAEEHAGKTKLQPPAAPFSVFAAFFCWPIGIMPLSHISNTQIDHQKDLALLRDLKEKQRQHELTELSARQTAINALAGAFSGVIVSVAFAPLDVIKTRFIVQRRPKNADPAKFSGIIGTMQSMVKNEGFRSLYKGLGTTMLGYIPNWALYFMIYEYSKGELGYRFGGTNTLTTNVASSVLAGAMTSFAVSPIWVIKTRMQTQVGDKGYANTVDAFRRIYQNEGIRAFYRGIVPSLFGLIHVAVQFPLYEKLKEMLRQRRHRGDPSMLDIVVASSVSKIIASVTAYPHEVLRSRLQDHAHGKELQVEGYHHKPYQNLRHAVETIWHEEGYRGFYRGLSTNLIRTVPAAVVTLLSFEMMAKRLSRVGVEATTSTAGGTGDIGRSDKTL